MTSLASAVLAHGPDRLAINGLTYGDVGARVRRVAAGLLAYGVTTGDRLAVLAHNTPETLVLLLACSAVGAILVPLNWRLAVPELQYILADAAPRLLWLDDAHAHLALALGGVTAVPEADGAVPAGDDSLPLLLIYTSGTTGRPKGAVLTGAALRANAALSQNMHRFTPDDHVLTVLPLFHVGGLNIQTTPALLLGARISLHPRFDPAATLHAIHTLRPTLTVLVPATLQACVEHPDWAATDLSSLRAVTTGSTIVPAGLVAPWQARGVPVLQVYGSTETCPIAIYQRLGDASTGTGHPGPGVEVRCEDGEILLRGPQLFQGYWRQPPALQDGWYRTGDLGTPSPAGWTIHDRRRNLIVSGGENVYPAEIERVLREHPAVREAAVVGEPDPRWGAVPVAYVECRSAVTEAALLAFVRAQLARFKVPRRVVVVDALPRNAMGKVVREGLGQAGSRAAGTPHQDRSPPQPAALSTGGLSGGVGVRPRPLRVARQLSRHPTPAESALWRAVRDVLGYRVKRQLPLGPYILDFAIQTAKLAVELDGDIHTTEAEYDKARTHWLQQHGWRVLRFSNAEVRTNPTGVLDAIKQAAQP